jgi:hypothetical protein
MSGVYKLDTMLPCTTEGLQAVPELRSGRYRADGADEAQKSLLLLPCPCCSPQYTHIQTTVLSPPLCCCDHHPFCTQRVILVKRAGSQAGKVVVQLWALTHESSRLVLPSKVVCKHLQRLALEPGQRWSLGWGGSAWCLLAAGCL